MSENSRNPSAKKTCIVRPTPRHLSSTALSNNRLRTAISLIRDNLTLLRESLSEAQILQLYRGENFQSHTEVADSPVSDEIENQNSPISSDTDSDETHFSELYGVENFNINILGSDVPNQGLLEFETSPGGDVPNSPVIGMLPHDFNSFTGSHVFEPDNHVYVTPIHRSPMLGETSRDWSSSTPPLVFEPNNHVDPTHDSSMFGTTPDWGSFTSEGDVFELFSPPIPQDDLEIFESSSIIIISSDKED